MNMSLAEMDKLGPPYVLPWPGERTYELALEVARSRHPSRVLANTNGYRFGRFTECPEDGHGPATVNVHMFGQHIATFEPEGVRVWTRGYVTPTTTEALSQLVNVGRFWTSKGVVYFGSYTEDEAAPLEEGQLIPYHRSA